MKTCPDHFDATCYKCVDSQVDELVLATVRSQLAWMDGHLAVLTNHALPEVAALCDKLLPRVRRALAGLEEVIGDDAQ